MPLFAFGSNARLSTMDRGMVHQTVHRCMMHRLIRHLWAIIAGAVVAAVPIGDLYIT